jgi:hypothetical protein
MLGTIRTRRKPGRWSGRYSPRSPAEWLAEGPVTCPIRFLNGDCMVDVRLDTLPLGRPWSRIGPNLFCTDRGAPGAMNIVPNWHDMPSRSAPFRKGWTR